MEESLNNDESKNPNVYNIENNNHSNIQIITNIAINQSLSSSQNKTNNDLISENQKEINQGTIKNNLNSSLDNILAENLREHSAIVGNINTRNSKQIINIKLKEEKNATYSKRLTKDNYSYLNRFIDYEKRKEMKLSKMQKEKKENEKKTLKKKPFISRKSVELINRLNLNDDILERMNDEEKKTKDKKEKLVHKINVERERKKKEIEKPNNFNIRITKFDSKFDKVYNEMMKKEENLKSKINAFANLVKEYEMRECVFQPNLSKYNNQKDENIKHKKRINSSDVTRRLYNDEIINRRNRANKLNEKYKLTFKPTISSKSIDLVIKKREQIKPISNKSFIEQNNNIKNNKI